MHYYVVNTVCNDGAGQGWGDGLKNAGKHKNTQKNGVTRRNSEVKGKRLYIITQCCKYI